MQPNASFKIMGIVNVTPDSFYDGGPYFSTEAAVQHGLELEAQGADLLDIGGESTRPGAEPVLAEDEIRRVVPVIERLVDNGVKTQISVDTSKLAVARAAVAVGATFVNDVTAFSNDPELAEFVAERDLECCLMHMQGTPRTMMDNPRYDDVVDDIKSFLEQRMKFAIAAGVKEERIYLDPGFGFGKTTEHDLELLRRLHEFKALGRPLLVGASRKKFLGAITGKTAPERLAATIAANLLAYEQGAYIFRVHDVAEVRDALTVTAAVGKD
jgi:dihydropteroate synthase